MRFFFSKSSFDKAAREHIYSTQNKPRGFEKLIPAFVDSNNVRYYKYQDDFDLPLKRKGQLDKYYAWLSSMMTGEELDSFCQAMTKALDDAINTVKLDGRLSGLAKCQAIINEMENRKKLIVHTDIYYRIIGVQYIREDQDPAEWDESLEAQKVEQFKKDSAGGLYGFFMESPLKRHMAFYGLSEEEWTDYMKESQAAVEGMKKWLHMLSSEGK